MKKKDLKNANAVALGEKRWSKVSKKDRIKHAKMMVLKRKEKYEKENKSSLS